MANWKSWLRNLLKRSPPDFLADDQPLRAGLLSTDLLRQFARDLAQSRKVEKSRGANHLIYRLAANEKILRDYNAETLRVEKKRRVTPAAEWLLDNFHLIEEQIRMARRHLPHGFHKQLPKLSNGPLTDFPRVYEIAQELIARTDGRIDATHLTSFIAGYQSAENLQLGELWAIPIMLRIGLIENLRRIAVLLTVERRERDAADYWADQIIEVAETAPARLIIVMGEMAQAQPTLSRAFVTEFWRRLREKTPTIKLAVSWLEERLNEDGVTIEQLVQNESQNQAATQVSVGNCIGSLRLLDTMDWQEFVESQSVVEQTLRTDPAQIYAQMDFATRDFYRHTIERIARHSQKTELEVAQTAIQLAQEKTGGNENDNRSAHVGFYLFGDGMKILERVAEMKFPFSSHLPRFARNHPLAFYLGSIFGITTFVTFLVVRWTFVAGIPPWQQILIGLLTLLCASQLSVSFVNWFATIFVSPSILPRLDFSKGIPAQDATLVVVPTMLTRLSTVENLLEALEVRYLANCDKNVFFALLTDLSDAPKENLPDDDALVKRASEGIQELNQKYKNDRANIFYLFHRPRKWNAQEKIWMGYERKRGKLSDLNHCLRGGETQAFSKVVGDIAQLQKIKYVITLDTDTQLPRDAARQLAATMAHPLNRPIYDRQRGIVIEGYSILQPRVAVSLPSAGRSRFVKLFSGEPGIDPYTRSVSDVYQDVFREGSFIGKGIYDVDAFEQAVGGKFPENRILSHDLLEGSYARAALVTDVQLFEDFPARYNVDTRRRHRWMRGDWQIATWLLPRLPGIDVRRVQKNPLSGLSHWKIFDNLRRSLVPLGLTALLISGWFLFPHNAGAWSLFVLVLIGATSVLAVLADFLRKPKELPLFLHFKNVGENVARQAGQFFLTVAFLPYDALVSFDAVTRTLVRLVFTRRKLLEWQTANESEQKSEGTLGNFFATMWSAPALVAAIILAFFFIPQNPQWRALAPFLLVWTFSPVIAWWISLPLEEKRENFSSEEILQLRKLARKTWNFFDRFVTAEDNWLPPDNFQESPRPALATRTSPTNMGMALIGALAAHDFGYLSTRDLSTRIARTLETLEKMDRYQTHFYNWYDTRTLKALPPLYLSTVDNGNLAGLLLTLHSGLLEITNVPWNAERIFSGLRDSIGILHEQFDEAKISAQFDALEKILSPVPILPPQALSVLNNFIAAIEKIPLPAEKNSENDFESQIKKLTQLGREQRDEIAARFPWTHLDEKFSPHFLAPENSALKDFWNDILNASLNDTIEKKHLWQKKLEELIQKHSVLANELTELRGLLEAAAQNAQAQIDEFAQLAQRCDELARMDFTLLYDSDRELFSIGFNVTQRKLDKSFYDLLASEARLASYVAIALGQIPQTHWFRLGRSLTTSGGNPTLISWSGSMFEYLMPMLVMPSYENTLLDLSCKSAVARQIEYGKQIHVPWGMSESGYNLRDAEANYQYRAFGVPGLGYKRGLADDVVIAPYATIMAMMIAPRASLNNLRELRRDDAEGKFGFYEALDFTASRVPSGQTYAVIRSFMAHHEGMSLLALTSTLLDRPMQRRFNANPLFKAAELLLHERVPKQTSVLYPHEIEAGSERQPTLGAEMNLRIFTDPNSGPPEVHLLSNGQYHVMVTNSGGGYSRWNDTAMTRWREDATRDCWGTFFYLRDTESEKIWSPAHQPTLETKENFEAIFSQGRAEFRARHEEIESHVEIAVSPEDNIEVRRVKLTNHSDDTRTIELTSYAEIVLNTAAADNAHPAFSNLFVQTEILPAQHTILCSRRLRASNEKSPLIFHLLLAAGNETGKISFETDRAKFLGRGGNTFSPAALRETSDLSNSEGSVLDPIAAIRRTVKIAPKETATFTLVAGIAATREEVFALVEKYQDQSIADRCFELAWTHGLIVLRHLNASESDAQLYGRLAGALLYHQAARRASPAVIARNSRGQRNLWSFGISGDLPIVVAYNTRSDQLDFVRQLVQAHAYWRLKGLAVELVILNEENSIYRQTLHDQILAIIGAGNAAQILDKPGGIFLRRMDQLSAEDRILLETVARVVLHDENGTLVEQLQARRARPELLPPTLRARNRPAEISPAEIPSRDLIFANGLGGFTRDGREYITTLNSEKTTPAPWANVLANPNFGTLISESGGAYTWSENCHEFRLTPWNNDAVTDVSGEAFYIRDERTGQFWSPTPLPARGQNPYVARHGFGYSVFEHSENGIASELQIFVAENEPVKFAILKLRNTSERRRQLSATGYWEWVLGELRPKNAMHVVTELDVQTGALLARNPYNTDFEGRVVFVTSNEIARSFTTDRTEFFGRNGTPAQPAALLRTRLSGKTGIGLDPCVALQVLIDLNSGEEREIIFILGAAKNLESAQNLVQKFRSAEACREELLAVQNSWNKTLGAVQVETPEPALNILANGWLAYQIISCRLWARTGFYQSGGAFGFRDQLQDAMALVHNRPELLREQILRAAAHQFPEGDVQHWWHPPVDRGVRTHISDDFLWLPFAVCRYVEAIGDTGVLNEGITFLEGRAVKPDEEAYYDLPGHSTEFVTLYEHCVRAIKNGLKFGEHGLPLMGCGDWNDGMNLVGEHGKGESVWLAFFLYDVLKHFAPLAEKRGDKNFAQHCNEQAKTLRENIEKNAWDGQWYRRAYFDNGEPLGSFQNTECQIDSLPQSWSVISGAGETARSQIALDSVLHRLVRHGAKLIQLFDPPFDKSTLEPGYIKGYVPGVRENGGQYTHAAIWTVMAFALIGEHTRAWELFQLINPVLHAKTPAEIARYKVEPYVVAADVYSVAPHTGRGGWTWYTGSAGWMFRLIAETFLGLNLEVDKLSFTPRVPANWKSFKIHYRYRETIYHLNFFNDSGNWKSLPKISLDKNPQTENKLTLVDDRKEHIVEVRFAN